MISIPKLNNTRTFFFLLGIIFLSCSLQIRAEDGVTDTSILFGQTAALDGPAGELGRSMNTGILAAFKEINDAGGVNGRLLRLAEHDDGYEPELAIQNAKHIIHHDRAFALIGGVGTPTANAIEPITTAQKIPFIAPFTGAEFLRHPFKRYVVNLRASYWQETEEWIKYLTEQKNLKRIAILYQDDSYGRAGLSGVQRAMAKRNLELVGKGTYKRNTTAVKVALLDIRKSNPDAVVIVGAYKPTAEFIKLSKKLKFNPVFVNISFVGSKALANELGEDGKGVIISQVVPYPFEGSTEPFVLKYQTALKAYSPEEDYGFVSLEGYIAGHFAATVLKQIEGDITRERFIDKIYETKTFDLGGIALNFDEQDNQGMNKIFMTILQKDGQFLPIE